MNKFYMTENKTFVMNYNRIYPRNRESLLKSKTFRAFILYFIQEQKEYVELYNYLTVNQKYTDEQAAEAFTRFLRQLSIFELEELDSEYANDKNMLL